MQYLMTDLHQRFIGSLNRSTPLVIGETLEVGEPDSVKSYTVVSIDASRSRDQNVKSVTVIVNSLSSTKAVE
ncbi:hypothetical protein Syn7502_00907 [Synechococcus sp. PCC 7502]|nr:hypothetical protein Syn7502_00907 [Synechococcus sp. PCC 7502]